MLFEFQHAARGALRPKIARHHGLPCGRRESFGRDVGAANKKEPLRKVVDQLSLSSFFLQRN